MAEQRGGRQRESGSAPNMDIFGRSESATPPQPDVREAPDDSASATHPSDSAPADSPATPPTQPEPAPPEGGIATVPEIADDVKPCRICGGTLLRHGAGDPAKEGAYHCNGCGACWASGIRQMRDGHPEPAHP